MSRIQPVGERLLVKLVAKPQDFKIGTLILPTSVDDQPIYEVISGEYSPGTKLIIQKFSGQEVEFDTETYFIIKSSDVLAFIEE